MADERINKARYWWAVLYQENMIPNWEEALADLVQVPYAYCCHTADVDSKSEHRKDHVHLILVFPNTTTYKHVLTIFGLLSAPGKKCVNTCQACVDIRHCYDYLIHDTESCRKLGKHLYDASERVTGNGFDIGFYEQISIAEKREILHELLQMVTQKRFMTMADFWGVILEMGADSVYFDVAVTYSRQIESLTRGNFLKYGEKNEKQDSATN